MWRFLALINLTVAVLVLLPAFAMASAINPPLLPGASSTKTHRPSASHYGIDLSGYDVERSVVRSGQSLRTMLRPFPVPASAIFKAAAISKSVFDVRNIIAGRPYSVVLDSKSGRRVKYLIYDQSPEKYVVFDFGKPMRVYTGRKLIETKIRMVSVTVTTSLWNAFAEKRLNPDLVLRLADVFASKTDFRRLHKGDHFRVIYEEQYAEGKPVGIGAIKAAALTDGDKIHQAFQFSHHGAVGYYDEEGRNLENAFLISPLTYTRISSGFSEKRLHPIKKSYRRHPAIDYAAPAGTPVMSIGEGIIMEIGRSRTAGKYIKVKHPGPYISEYGHLSSFEKGIKMNSPVKKGDIIGFVGSTGLATGPHLDFRFMKNGRYVNYFCAKLPAGQPVDAECQKRFDQTVSQYASKLSFSPEMAFINRDGEKGDEFFELTSKTLKSDGLFVSQREFIW